MKTTEYPSSGGGECPWPLVPYGGNGTVFLTQQMQVLNAAGAAANPAIPTAGRTYTYPFKLGFAERFQQVKVHVNTTPGSADAVAKCGIYSVTPAGLPDILLAQLELGAGNWNSVGNKSFDFAALGLTLVHWRAYYVALIFSGTTRPTLSTTTLTPSWFIGSRDYNTTLDGVTTWPSWMKAGTYATEMCNPWSGQLGIADRNIRVGIYCSP